MTLNCSVTGELTYKWCVDRLQGSALQAGGDDWSGKSERVRVESHLLHHPQLLLPPHTLSLGLHLLTLQVRQAHLLVLILFSWDGKAED